MNPKHPSSSEGAPIDGPRPRVLVVDDSAPLRAAIAEVLEEGGCDVVGRAMDGSMALRMMMETDPDVITCDLEMPRMDGFTFLRILQTMKPTPVIVITSDARPEAALMALELGARDFVVKPGRAGDVHRLRHQLVARVHALTAQRAKPTPTWTAPGDVALPRAAMLVAIGSSTGGPRALRDILAALRAPPRLPVVIAQHMPPRFTEAFAARLGRTTGLDVAEAHDGDVLRPGTVRIAPGGKHLRVESADSGFRARVLDPDPGDRWVPGVDQLLESAAAAAGKGVLGIVLTGMGKDGFEGARALRAVGAPLWAEAALTATVGGMPNASALGHGAAERIPLDELAALLARLLSPA